MMPRSMSSRAARHFDRWHSGQTQERQASVNALLVERLATVRVDFEQRP
jgi:hypothetical protein